MRAFVVGALLLVGAGGASAGEAEYVSAAEAAVLNIVGRLGLEVRDTHYLNDAGGFAKCFRREGLSEGDLREVVQGGEIDPRVKRCLEQLM